MNEWPPVSSGRSHTHHARYGCLLAAHHRSDCHGRHHIDWELIEDRIGGDDLDLIAVAIDREMLISDGGFGSCSGGGRASCSAAASSSSSSSPASS